jgi:hypothetical protein
MNMNQTRIASTVFCLLFATFACAVEPRQEPQPQQQEEPKAKPDKDVPHDRDAKPSKDAKPPKQDESKPAKQQEQEKANAKKDERPPQGQSRPAGKSARIPDDKFRANFGHQHTFAIGHPEIVGGQPQFQYSGYSFQIVDPWPTEWAYTDEVYVDYIDGEYYIFDMVHPGVRISVTVIL